MSPPVKQQEVVMRGKKRNIYGIPWHGETDLYTRHVRLSTVFGGKPAEL